MVWCSVAIMNGYRRLLTKTLHGIAAELCLANSVNNNVATTKYIEYNNSIHTYVFLSDGVGKVLF